MYDNGNEGLGVAPAIVAAAVKAPGFVSRLIKAPAHVAAASELATLVPKAISGDQGAYARIQHLSTNAATQRAKNLALAALRQVDAARGAATTLVTKAAPIIASAAAADVESRATAALKGIPMLPLLLIAGLFLLGGRR